MEESMKKLNVGILCGGQSAEHEVSLQSAKNVFDAMDHEKYQPILIGIDKTGTWFRSETLDCILDQGDPKRIHLDPGAEAFSPGQLFTQKGQTGDQRLDVIFPILHGPLGEDGTVQGLLKLAGLPFVGAGVLGSAAGMDKDVMKRLLRDAGLPIGAFLCLKSHEALPDFKAVVDRLGLPVFVKPANMGSSVGVSKVHGQEEYHQALREAFQYDTKIIIEEFIPGRELECSVLGSEKPSASLPGEVKSTHEFYSYDAKYIDENGAVLDIPAKLPEQSIKAIQDLAVKTFEVLCCEDLARVDFFMKPDGSLIVNEINTMPGFTKISMYPKLWEASGISYGDLIDRLITLGLKKARTV
jgi:D-alanine-D-alanine ligase